MPKYLNALVGNLKTYLSGFYSSYEAEIHSASLLEIYLLMDEQDETVGAPKTTIEVDRDEEILTDQVERVIP